MLKKGRRLIAIGDIHGCSAALEALLDLIQPQADDTIVTLGDYVDRGIDGRGVLDQLLTLNRQCQLIPLFGNHEEMMLNAARSRTAFDFWMHCGGQATLDSYGDCGRLTQIPQAHLDFLESCRNYFETEDFFFVHGNYEAELRLEEQPPVVARWFALDERMPVAHYSGKTAIVGHTPQLDGRILDLGYLKCLDTGCGHGGWLTALEPTTGEVWRTPDIPNHRVRSLSRPSRTS
jgi:serine/threonine protein phosphatase 1